MTSSATITGTVDYPGTDNGVAGKVIIRPQAVGEWLSLSDRNTMGPCVGETDTAGTIQGGGIKVPIVGGLLWTVQFIPNARDLTAYTLGTFALSASADIRTLIPTTPTAITASDRTNILDMIASLAGFTGATDALVAPLVPTASGSAVSVALDSAFARKTKVVILPSGGDDTAALNAAFTAATVDTTIELYGTYAITGKVTVLCDLAATSATINYTGTGVALQLGSGVSGAANFNYMRFEVGKVICLSKPGTGWVAGTVGVKAINLVGCHVSVQQVKGFETGLWTRGVGYGCMSNIFPLGWLNNNKVNLRLDNDATGWNADGLYLGGLGSHNGSEGTAVSGVTNLLITQDSGATYLPDFNHFLKYMVEGNAEEFMVDIPAGQGNVIQGSRFEGTTPQIRWGAKATDNQVFGGDIYLLTATTITGATGNVITSLASMRGPKVEVFAAGTWTWTKATGASTVDVLLIGAGGGSGSGRRGAAGTVRCGGGSGGSGSGSRHVFRASDLPATVRVQVAAGGAGGAAVTTDDTNGNPGARPASSTYFGTAEPSALLATALAVNGAGGTNATGTGGVAPVPAQISGSKGANASTTGTAGTSADSQAVQGQGPTGGGSGGGLTVADVASAGGAGSLIAQRPAGAVPAGGAVGANGTSATAPTYPGEFGHGGAGGGSSSTAAGGAGGAGVVGGGGGGGGASLNGFASGAGGAGGDGLAVIITNFG